MIFHASISTSWGDSPEVPARVIHTATLDTDKPLRAMQTIDDLITRYVELMEVEGTEFTLPTIKGELRTRCLRALDNGAEGDFPRGVTDTYIDSYSHIAKLHLYADPEDC